MEAATLNSPQRKLDVVPVQKSLSLPSYARAGGEGIDHRVIFAALEQREKIRRKSRIFAREKSARQNIFCLPISSGNKCRETSLSSDTSCSSLEYQKPKPASKPKRDEKPRPPIDELPVAKTSRPEDKSNPSHQNVAAAAPTATDADNEPQKNSLKLDHRKGHRSPSDTLRPNLNSSDSMERSSRSSNDSLSRRERLVAIKARVEAAREKYGDTSSEEENRNGISRYNSDGVIHRTVKEVKSRSYRLEKRLRRRSQDEYALKKANRKNNLSLCLNSVEDGIKLDLEWALNIFEDGRNTECKTDFCPSPNFLDFTKKNYYSDFPSSKENMSRVVQARIKQIEEEERKRRNGSDFRDKTKSSSRQSPHNAENSSPFSTHISSNQNAAGSLDMEKMSTSSDIVHCQSPVGRAPTPPPRSPKSISFVNKVYKQHQNACLNQDTHSLERKTNFQPNIPLTSQDSSPKCDATMADSKKKLEFVDDVAERRRMRQLFNSRRKTCGYFDYTDNFAFKELNSAVDKATPSKSTAVLCNLNILQSDARGYNSGSDASHGVSEDPTRRLRRSKWEETEKRQEFMFNSLESKKKSPSWLREPKTPQNCEQCICQIVSGSKHCTCSLGRRNYGNKLCTSATNKFEGFSKNLGANDACHSSRLSKSELNIAYSDETKSNGYDMKLENLLRDFKPSESKSEKEKVENTEQVDKLSATANLDSAMEELESVYRSLKFSSDNLSEKNSASNLSLNDLNAETPKKDVLTISDNHFKPSSSKENNNFNLYSNKSSNTKPGNDKRPLEFLKLSVYSPSSNFARKCKSPEAGNLCIDEMFNDLTRQLDIEQKLLKESRDRTPAIKSQNGVNSVFQADQSHKSESKRMSPLESIVSIRKELYDNLQKSSQKQHSRPFNASPKDPNKSDNCEMTEKKHKAARTLSENISYLMASDYPKPVAKAMPSEKTGSPNVQTSEIEKTSPKHYEHVILEPFKAETKREISLKQPIVPKRACLPDHQKKPAMEEIRQIRVSMDSSAPDTATAQGINRSEYPRLTSVVRSSRLCSKPDATPRSLPDCNASGVPKETDNLLDENGLEKLLNTLLHDVPESKQSSLLVSREGTPPTPPPAAPGEMRVLQHLDILRLKPIPS